MWNDFEESWERESRRKSMRRLAVAKAIIVIVILAIGFACIALLNNVMDSQTELRELLENPPKEQAVEIEEEPAETVSLGEFRLTHYCSCPICCGKYADGITATGTTVEAGRTIAVDPDIIPLGTEVIIDDHTYIAEDTGTEIKGNRIDIYCESHSEALNRGVVYREVEVIK